MATTTTPFMNLVLPNVLEELGPAWAQEINDAFEAVDEHDHSSEKGVKVKTAGLQINADLTFGNFSATNLKSTKYQNLSATLTGVLNSNSIYAVDGDLYFTNASGLAVQITNGGSIVSAPSTVQSYETIFAASSLVISNSDNFVFISVDTNAARSVTLPLASSVSVGRFYIIKDEDGLADVNNITITPTGGDTIDKAATLTVASPFSATHLISDGVSNWSLI